MMSSRAPRGVEMQSRKSEGNLSLIDELEHRSLHHSVKAAEKESRSRIILLLITLSLSIIFVVYHETIRLEAVDSELNELELEVENMNASAHFGNDDHDTVLTILSNPVHDDDNDNYEDVDNVDDPNYVTHNLEAKETVSSSSSSNEHETTLLSSIDLKPLKNNIEKSFQDYQRIMNEDYGKFTNVFSRENILNNIITSASSLSEERFKRRLKIKILQSQLQLQKKQDPDNHNDDDDDITTFTWVVGGHSAAAGHGNLLKQAYAAVLERTVSPLFESLGITFRAKNYAMGGTNSGPEIAICINSLFGMDMDALSWDYGMMDTSINWYYSLWAERVGVHPTTPILFSNGIHGHDDINKEFEQKGLGAFFIDLNYSRVLAHFPDSLDPNVDVSELPPLLKYYICNDHIEKDEPCKTNKWHTEECLPKAVAYQSSWHNGWKDHQYYGNLLSAFVIFNLLDAVEELIADTSNNGLESSSRLRRLGDNNQITTKKPELNAKYLDYLLSLEQEDKNKFLSSKVTKNIGFNSRKGNLGAEIFAHFQRGNAICHSSILPSQARYDGLVTESGVKSEYIGGGRTTYVQPEGFSSLSLPKANETATLSPFLVYDPKSRDICDLAEIDFKDYFCVRSEDRWMTMVVPNDSEYEVFKRDDVEPVGLVMMCTLYCNFGHCPADYAEITELVSSASDEYGVIVNGVKAVGVTDIDESGQHRCKVLQHKDGYFFPTSPSDGSLKGVKGRFKIEMSIEKPKRRLYLTSVIVV